MTFTSEGCHDARMIELRDARGTERVPAFVYLVLHARGCEVTLLSRHGELRRTSLSLSVSSVPSTGVKEIQGEQGWERREGGRKGETKAVPPDSISQRIVTALCGICSHAFSGTAPWELHSTH